MEQGTASGPVLGYNVGTDPNWRSRLSVEDRQRMINNIKETFRIAIPLPVPDRPDRFAVMLEADMYNTATCWFDYLMQFGMRTHYLCGDVNFLIQRAINPPTRRRLW